MKLWGTVNSRYLADWTSRTLLYLKQFIPSLVHLALDQSKHSRYFKTRYLKFFLMPNNFYGLLSNFLSLSQTFSKTFTTFWSFSSNISLFSNRAGTISSIVATRISEDSQIYFFFVLFFVECFTSIFSSLEYSIKSLLKDCLTEINGVFKFSKFRYHWLLLPRTFFSFLSVLVISWDDCACFEFLLRPWKLINE